MSHRPFSVSLIAGVLFVVASSAGGATLFVANNGVDGPLCSGLDCGSKASPCRSITCAIGNAKAGDTIVVGPGRYGDLDNDGVLGSPGDETGSPGCGCMVSVNKPVAVISSQGAASTVIDALNVATAKNVLLILNGGEFGRPGKGFTVTNTKAMDGDGIVIDSANVKVRGNQVLATAYVFNALVPRPGIGIRALFGGPILVEANQVIGGWGTSIVAEGTGKTVRKNQVSTSPRIGIHAEGDTVVEGNVVTAMGNGIEVLDGASAIGNAVNGNSYGILARATETRPFSGTIEQNDLLDNQGCGLTNDETSGLQATNNYWGSATGPGPDPADDICNKGMATTSAVPFATKPFTVNAPIKP